LQPLRYPQLPFINPLLRFTLETAKRIDKKAALIQACSAMGKYHPYGLAGVKKTKGLLRDMALKTR
jgi:hypothetical protein